MALIGNTPEFNIVKDDWTLYTEILEQYFEINSIDDSKKCAYLISVIGKDCYKILSEICYPDTPKNKSYEELCYLLSKQFENKNSIFVIRNKFYRAAQYPTESITLWFNRVKKLSKDCRFAGNIESILVDRFISGIKQIPLDDFYFENNSVSLDKAFNMALEREKNYQPINSNRNRNQNNKKNNEKVENSFEIIEKKNNLGESSGSKKKDAYFLKANDVMDQGNNANNLGKFNQNSSNINEGNPFLWKAGNTKEQFQTFPVQHKHPNLPKSQPSVRGSLKSYPVQQQQHNFHKHQNRQPAQQSSRRYASEKNVQYYEEESEEEIVEEYPRERRRRNRRKPKQEENDACVLC